MSTCTRLCPNVSSTAAVEAHTGDYRSLLKRHHHDAHIAVADGRRGLRRIGPQLLNRIADTRNLRVAWDHLAQYGGPTPGPNGLHYTDLEGDEIWELMRALRSAILTGVYRPGAVRTCRIPKASGIGHRVLTLQNIEDRILHRAIKQIVEPLWDPWFSNDSYGFRPNRDRRHALARAEALTLTQGRCIWIVDDIRDAFDQVPRARLLDIVGRTLPEDVVALIRIAIDEECQRGLMQGSPLSPLLLNVYLDHFLDRPWRKRSPNLPLLRTADDIVMLCRSTDEAANAYGQLTELLRPAGMPLKGDPHTSVVDLGSGDQADWLGFEIGLDGTELNIGLGARTWMRLREGLERAHEGPNAPLVAREIVRGWIEQAGPCYVSTDVGAVYERIEAIASSLAFDEILSADEVAELWKESYRRWREIGR